MKLCRLVLLVTALIAAASACTSGPSKEAPKSLCPPEIRGEALYIPLGASIALDGELSDWSRIPLTIVDRGPMVSKDPAENGSFSFAAASDGKRLYVLMLAVDANIITGKHKQDWWNEDSMEFYVNLGPDLAATRYGRGIAQINIKPIDIGKEDPKALTLSGTNADTMKVEGIVFKTADGWGFEAAIDLEGLIEPRHGLEIGFQAQMNGASIKDRDVKLIWSLADTSDNSWQNPSLFGRGIFFEPGRTDIPLPTKLAAKASPAPEPTPAPIRAAIAYNQVGYRAQGPKFASIAKDAPGPFAWELREEVTGEIVAKGETLPPVTEALSGDKVHRADFSAFEEPGIYSIAIAGELSAPFIIDDAIYDDLARDALAYFYLSRSGIALIEDLAGSDYARPAGHLSDADIRAFKGKDAQGREWPGFPFAIDGSGGWYDAGDYGKYVVNGGISVWTLMNAYELRTSAYKDGAARVPEAGNGAPDILDEARWELEFMLRMQIPEGHELSGMAFHKLHDRNWSAVPSALPEFYDNNNDYSDGASWGRYVYQPTTAATLNLAACAAQASRVWENIDPDFAARCLSAARAAWSAALAHPAMLAGNVPGGGGGNYDDGRLDDEFYWAACELYAATLDDEYGAFVISSPYKTRIQGADGAKADSMNWGDTAALGTISLALNPSTVPEELVAAQRGLIVEAADRYAGIVESSGYGAPMGEVGFVWGSNAVALNNAIILALAHDFTGDVRYLNAASRVMDYLLGHNALKKSFVSGYGQDPMRHPHHRLWGNKPEAGFPAPPAGALAGGPNAQIQDPAAEAAGLASVPVAKRYIDDIGSYATNEVAINWNAPLAWLAAYLSAR
jgi:endoglucanase